MKVLEIGKETFLCSSQKRSTSESFFVEENVEISLRLMTMCTEQQCCAPQLVGINRFSEDK